MTFAYAAPSGASALTTSTDTALRVVAVVFALVLVSIVTFVPLSQNDFWLQAAVGRIIVETGDIPRTVLFTFTWARDSEFFPHEWLPSIGFYLLLENLGYDRLRLVQGALGLLLFGMSFGLAFRLCRSTGVAILLACMAMAVANYRHYLRPEILALVLLLAQLHLLTLYRMRGERRFLVGCLLLAIIWANSHGSFLMGPIVAAIFACGEAIEAARAGSTQSLQSRMRVCTVAGAPYAITALGMVVVSLVNPQGVGLFHFVSAVAGSEVFKAGIQEWNPTFSSQFMGSPGFWIFIGCLTVTGALVIAFWRRLSATDVLMLFAFLVLAVMRQRYVVFFGFIAMLIGARLIGIGVWRRELERLALGVSIGASAAGIALALQFGNAYRAYPYHSASSELTEPMIAQLSAPGVQGNVFNSYELGAELIYRFYPQLRPSMDSRADSYGEAYLLFQNELLVNEKMLKEFVTEFDVRYMLLSWRDFESLKKQPGLRDTWKMQFADHKAVLLVRQTDRAASVGTPGQ